MNAGDAIEVLVFNLDGTCRRWWTSTIETIDDGCLRTISRVGTSIDGPKGGWVSRVNIRSFYWFNRPYNLMEVYNAAGDLAELYVHLASPARIVDGQMHYADHELDVVRRPGEAPFIDDEDEFEQAIADQEYPAAFRAACYRTANEVTALIKSWIPLGW